jgi:membrane protease YdiL (CAAX protease family)
MNASRRLFTTLALVLIVWYLFTTLPPKFVNTCLGGSCSSALDIAMTVLLPLLAIAVTVVAEMGLFKETLPQALRILGIGRPDGGALRLALLLLLPVIAFFPIFSLLSGMPLALNANWPWIVLAVILYNGINEELMFRGLIFRRLREGRTFRRAAALSAIYFAAAHIPLLLILGPVLGVIAIVLSVPAAIPTAYLFERGRNTIWGGALLHAVMDAIPSIVVISATVSSAALSLYLLVSLAVSVVFAVLVYRGKVRGIDELPEAAPIRQSLAGRPSL